MNQKKLMSFVLTITILAGAGIGIPVPTTAMAASAGLATKKLSWPKEAVQFGFPEPKKGKLITSGTIKKTTIIDYAGLKRGDIDSYLKVIEKSGFHKGVIYPGGVMWNYVKNLKSGHVNATLSFNIALGSLSIILEEKQGNSNASAATAKKLKWLEKVPKKVPIFTKGTLTEAEAESALPTMIFKNVKKADLDAYKKALLKAGFSLTDGKSDLNLEYEFVDAAHMQMIMINLSYKDGYLTMRIMST